MTILILASFFILCTAEHGVMDIKYDLPDIYDCSVTTHESSIPLPEMPSCSHAKKVDRERYPIVVTLFKEDMSYREIDAYSCKSEYRCRECKYKTQYIFRNWMEIRNTTPSECHEKASPMWKPQDGEIVTENAREKLIEKPACSKDSCCWWPQTNSGCGIYYRISKTKILQSKNSSNSLAMVPGVGHCNASKGSCWITPDSITVWSPPQKFRGCRLLPYKEFPGILTFFNSSAVITLVGENLLFKFSRSRESRSANCQWKNATVLESDEGFHMSIAGNSSLSIERLRKFSHSDRANATKVNLNTTQESSPISLDKSVIQFVMTDMRNYTNFMLREVENQVCKESKSIWQAAWALRKEYPSEAVKLFLGTVGVIGSVQAGGIKYRKCSVIDKWDFLYYGYCKGLWKIRGNISSSNCLESGSNELFTCPEGCEGSKTSNNYYFRTRDGGVISLTGVSYKKIPSSSVDYSLKLIDEPYTVKYPVLYSADEMIFSKARYQEIDAFDQKILSLEEFMGIESHEDLRGIPSYVHRESVWSTLTSPLGIVGGWIGVFGKILWIIFIGVIVFVLIKTLFIIARILIRILDALRNQESNNLVEKYKRRNGNNEKSPSKWDSVI